MLTADADGLVNFERPPAGATYLTVHAPGYFARSVRYRETKGEVRLSRAGELHVRFENLPPGFAMEHPLGVRLHYSDAERPASDPVRWTHAWSRRTGLAAVRRVPPGGEVVLQHVIEVPGYVDVFLHGEWLIDRTSIVPSRHRLVIDFAKVLRGLRSGYDASLSLVVLLPPSIDEFRTKLYDKPGCRSRPVATQSWSGQKRDGTVTLTFLGLPPGRFAPRLQYKSPANGGMVSAYLAPIQVRGYTEAVRTLPAGARLEVSLEPYPYPVNPIIEVDDKAGRLVTMVSMKDTPGYRANIGCLAPGTYRVFAFDPAKRLLSRSAIVEVTSPGQDLGARHFQLARELELEVVVGSLEETAKSLAIYHVPDNGLERDMEITNESWQQELKLPEGEYRLVATYPSGRKVEKTIAFDTKGQRLSLE